MEIGKKEFIAYEVNDESKFTDLQDVSFYLGNKLISDESIYVSTYIYSLEQFISKLKNNQYRIKPLEGLTPNQLFEKLTYERESNQKQYFKHLFQLDETINQYSIFVFDQVDSVLLLWSCWDTHHCNPDHVLKEIYWVEIPIEIIRTTMERLIVELKK